MTRGKVLLVYPYFFTGIVKDQIFPPLGISLLSAVLKQQGVAVEKLDCTFLSRKEACARAIASQPDLVGFYVMSTLAKNAVELLQDFRTILPDRIFIAGGPLPTLYPARFAQSFDYVFKGEAARSYPRFCRDFLDAPDRLAFLANLPADGYPGLYGQGLDAPAEHLSRAEIDALPLPDRTGFDHRNYQELSQKSSGRKKASLMTSFGCPFACNFCSKPIFGNQVRFRSLDSIFAEISDIMSFGYDSLWIADDLFTYSARFLKSFCARMAAEKLPLSWSCLSRTDCITDELAAAMKNAGCDKVYLGIESGDDQILSLMNKRTDTVAIQAGVQIFNRQNIHCAGFFMVGYPGETMATIEKTFQFALSLPLEEISFNVPYPLPGSRLYETVSGVRADDWNYENETRFLYDSDFDQAWLKRRIDETMAQFERKKADFSPRTART